MLALVCSFVFILNLIQNFCECSTVEKNLQFVCLHNIECNLTFDTDIHLDVIYLSNSNCILDDHVTKLKFFSPQNLRYVAKWKPEEDFKLGEETKLCASHKNGLNYLLDYTRKIKLYSYGTFYLIDDNNDLNFVLSKCNKDNVHLLISKKERYRPDADHPKYTFLKFGDRQVSYAPLNTLTKSYSQDSEFFDAYIYIFVEDETDFLTLIDRVKFFNHDLIKGFDHKVIENHIVVEIKGINLDLETKASHIEEPEEKVTPIIPEVKPDVSQEDNNTSDEGEDNGSDEENDEHTVKESLEKSQKDNPFENRKDYEKVYLIAQSSIDRNGAPSKCGSPDTLWHLLNVPYHINKEEDKQKSVILILPLELHGQTIKICAGFVEDKLDSYKTPIFTFDADDLSTGYYKNVFQASPLGIAEITLESDFHPLSEIKLVHACDLPEGTTMRNSFATLQQCQKYEEYRPGFNQLESVYNPNISYTPQELYLSLDNQNILTTKSIPHRLVYLPDKSVLSKSGTRWTKNSIFLPRLYAEPNLPYIIQVCDRWKHPLCFTDQEFNSRIGLIYPSRNHVLNISSEWDQDCLIIELETLSTKPPVIKLVISNNFQYVDHSSKCNNPLGFYPLEGEKSQNEGTNKFTYKIKGLYPGKLYYLCSLREESKTNISEELKEVYQKQEHKLSEKLQKYLKENIKWEFFGIINSHTVLTGTRLTFNKSGEKLNLMFPTTGFKEDISINSFYFTMDMTFDCRSLQTFETITISVKKFDYFKVINFVKNNIQKVTQSHDSPGHDVTMDGFWLNPNSSIWKTVGKYINYEGKFEGKDNLYKVCGCIEGHCYYTGNAAYSKRESFELSQFIKTNDIYDRLILGKYLCLHNSTKIVCFEGSDEFKSSIKFEKEFYIPEIRINHVSFDNETNLLSILSPNRLYIYDTGLESKMEIKNIINMEMMFSFQKVTMFITRNELYAYTQESTVFNKILEQLRKRDLREPDKFQQQDEITLKEEHLIPLLIDIKGEIENLDIYQIDQNNFYYFIIDENMNLNYHKLSINFQEKMMEMENKYRLDLGKYLPGDQKGLVMKVKKMTIFGRELLLFFVTKYESSEIIVFYLENEEIKFYSVVKAVTGITDFVTTKTHIISLKSMVHKDEVNQYIFQKQYDNLLEVTLKYPTLTTMIYGENYSHEPKISNGIVLRIYTDEMGSEEENEDVEYPIGDTGFTINNHTGVISGSPKFIGATNIKINLEILLGKTSIEIEMTSKCPLGYEPDSGHSTCIRCAKGFYRNKMSMDTCVSCNEYIPNTTTKSEGNDTPLACHCIEGYYFSNLTCVMCPPGTYNDRIGSFACEGKCPENQTSLISGSSSLEQLNCKCIKGYFKKENDCEKCKIGSYCPGDNSTIVCPENTSTKSEGAYSEDECVCNPGHEYVNKTCSPCQKDSYKPNLGNEMCTKCSSEDQGEFQSYTMKLGSTSAEECQYCMPGTYFDGKRCSHCPSGFVCKGDKYKPAPCPENTIILKYNPTDHSDCLCPKGYGSSVLGTFRNFPRSCTKCPPSTFQPIDGNVLGCIRCPTNTYTPLEGSTSLRDCITRPGYYNFSYSNFPKEIEYIESKIQKHPLTNMEQIDVECIRTDQKLAGYNITLTRDLKECMELCKSNPYYKYFYYHEFIPGANDISANPQGYNRWNDCQLYTTFDLKLPDMMESVIIINPKEYEGPMLCQVIREYLYPKFVECPRNYYCPGGITSLKIQCPSFSVTSGQGSTSIQDCRCLPGYYLLEEICVPCKQGYYKSKISNDACTKCPDNQTTEKEGSFTISQCGCNKNMYAVKIARTKLQSTSKLVYVNPELPYKDEISEDYQVGNIDEFLMDKINKSFYQPLEYYCSICLTGYFCKGLWMYSGVHMPPIPCFKGSSVPFSTNIHSINSCLCDPGFGLQNYKSQIHPQYGLSCQLCPPGTYKRVYENSPCLETCPVHSTSLPGSTSERQCFCIPGFYMGSDSNKFNCQKCTKEALCPGGLENSHHAMPKPKAGFAIVDSTSNRISELTSLIQTSQPSHRINKDDPLNYIYPCMNADRCIGHNLCSPGSKGLLCSQCDQGYDVYHFNSTCSKCSKEMLKFVVPRILTVLILIALCSYNNHMNRVSELSPIPILKITYMFVLSMVPLGMIPINTKSSVIKYQEIFKKYFLLPLNLYAKVDRVNCSKKLALMIMKLLYKLGIKFQTSPNTSIPYRYVWYLQRYTGILKIIMDVLLLLFINLIWFFASNFLDSYGKKYRKRLQELSSRIEGDDISLESLVIEKVFKSKNKIRINKIIQQLLVLICFHIPSIFLNSLAMLLCKPSPFNNKYLILNLPEQICTPESKTFLYGLITGIISIVFLAVFIFILFILIIKLSHNNQICRIFTSGYKVKYRHWDIVQLLRQILIISLVVCQISIGSSKPELNRPLLNLILNIFYLILLLDYEPYDSRSGFMFLQLEKRLVCTNIYISLFMYGSHLHNLSLIGEIPLVFAASFYLLIPLIFLKEFVSISKITSKSDKPFSETLIRTFKSYFKNNNSFLYFDQNEDNLLYQSYQDKNIWSKSSLMNLLRNDNKKFLLSIIKELVEKCLSLDGNKIFSNKFCYFYIHMIFWHYSCFKINIYKDDISDKDLDSMICYLYYFDESQEDIIVELLAKYPFKTLQSHKTYNHKSMECDETCSIFSNTNHHQSIDEIAASLLVDSLFNKKYNKPISLAEFYYSFLSMSRINEAKLNVIFRIYQKHIIYIRNPAKYKSKTVIKSIRSEIKKHKRSTEIGDGGGLIITKYDLMENVDGLNSEIEKLNDTIKLKKKSLEETKKHMSRASALKVGVENVLSGKLNNEEIIGSIDKINQIHGGPRRSRLSLSKKRTVEPVYILKVT